MSDVTVEINDVLDDHWRELETRQLPAASDVFFVTELPVPTSMGALAVALDSQGFRHILIPVTAHQDVRRGVNGPVLNLRKRSLEAGGVRRSYADLGCLRADLNDLFTTLCADIVLTIESDGVTNPLKSLNHVLSRWKALFQSPGPPLGPEQLAGLFGELIVLEQLLELNSSAHRLWRGPAGYRHDFAADKGAIEVKTSTKSNVREVRIHGLDQLDGPADGDLDLVWIRLESGTGDGVGVIEQVDRVLALSDDEAAVLEQLSSAGYRRADDEHYRHVRFRVDEKRWYRVDVAFPRLTTSGLAAVEISPNVRDVSYTINLSGESPRPMESTQIERQLRAMLEHTL